MFRYNLKFVLRHLLKYKSYAAINIVGLALGMTCALYIFLWIYNEISYDRFHKNGEQLYEVFWYRKGSDGKPFISGDLPSPVTTAIMQQVPEVAAATRTQMRSGSLIKYKNKSIFSEGYYADTSFFTMFSFDLTKGNPKLVLKDPESIVISEKLAKKLFIDEDPVGRTLMLGDMGNRVLKVTGVFRNVPANSTLQFDYVSPVNGFIAGKSWLQDWGEYFFSAYIQLAPNTSIADINSKVKDILKKNGAVNFELFIYPFSKLHLGSDLDYKEYHYNGNVGLLKSLFWIALLVLMIACINFMNLAVALAMKRAREVVIKKILGSDKKKLIRQFFGEALVMSMIALLLTITIVEVLLPSFNTIFSSNITLTYSNPWLIGCMVFIIMFTTFFAGIYPSFFLASFQPITILKGYRGKKKYERILRDILVVFQFASSIILIICTIAVDKQMHYIRDKQLGINKELVINFNTYAGIWPKRIQFKKELQNLPGVEKVTYSEQNPLNVQHLTQDFRWKGKATDDNRWFALINTDIDFLKTFNIKIIKGRDFSDLYNDHTNICIINETAAKTMGLKEPLEEPVSFWKNQGKIVGIIKDFHMNDFYQSMRPLVIRVCSDNASSIFVRLNPNATHTTIEKIRNTYQKYESDYPFEYKFELDYFENMYKDNIKFIGTLSTIFSLFTIFIACLGLFGLTSFTAELRTKEIGIRKINGAGTANLLFMLLKSFVKLVVIAYVLACPIAFYAVHKWFESFAYHTELSWWIFIATGLIALIMALTTVYWQAWRAASRNPVDTLRYE
jgi:putative ABC transport system permease protein